MIEEVSTEELRKKLDAKEGIQMVDIREEHEVRENPVFVEGRSRSWNTVLSRYGKHRKLN